MKFEDGSLLEPWQSDRPRVSQIWIMAQGYRLGNEILRTQNEVKKDGVSVTKSVARKQARWHPSLPRPLLFGLLSGRSVVDMKGLVGQQNVTSFATIVLATRASSSLFKKV